MQLGRHWFCIGLLGSMLCSAAVAFAAGNLASLASSATLIVRGTVLSQKSSWNANHRQLYTEVRLRVAQVYKGQQAQEVTIHRLGGSADGIGMRVFGEAEYRQGEEVFVFLRRLPYHHGEGSEFTPVGLARGKFHLVRTSGKN